MLKQRSNEILYSLQVYISRATEWKLPISVGIQQQQQQISGDVVVIETLCRDGSGRGVDSSSRDVPSGVLMWAAVDYTANKIIITFLERL